MTDRELDAKIATELFGVEVLDLLIVVSEKLPHYSSTGDGMLQVIEKMRERGWEWRSSWLSEDCLCSFSLRNFPRSYQEFAVTAPRAVALAALKALEGEKKE